MKILSGILTYAVLILIVILVPQDSGTNETYNKTLFVKNKFFVKTTVDLGISEATGMIMPLNTGFSTLDNLNNKYGISRIERVFNLFNGDPVIYNKLEMSRIYVFYTDDFFRYDDIPAIYGENEFVEYAEPVYIGFAAGEKVVQDTLYPDDTYFSKQWYLDNAGNIKPSSGGAGKEGEDINMLKAWEVEQGSEEIIIAILDSGIDERSKDLKGRVWINKKEIPDNDIDDDRNGYTDDYKGWDFAYDDNSAGDGFGHGTNIASVIGANTNNGFGFAGINPKSRLMNCKNLSDNNSGEYEWWAQSLKYAVDNGAKIINMSEGGDDYSKVLKTAVDYAVMRGAFISAAMMNRGDGRNYYPASIPGVFAVGATDTDGKRCRRFSWGGGSCYGKHISVVAPGNKIYGVDYEDPYKFDTFWSGTSQSTAIVSGLASLLLSQDNTRSAEAIKSIIRNTAVDRTGDLTEDKQGWDMYYGYGRVDCFLALTYNNPEKRNKVEEEYRDRKPDIKDEEILEKPKDKKPAEHDDGGAKSKPVNKSKENETDKPAKKR
ncbi:MAG: S8 family serine peptidase [Ignavibacteria bacterium]|jgi:subtilisin family serine protease|nr:S8 family serine peptidase [Ignavibacteria bacterium]